MSLKPMKKTDLKKEWLKGRDVGRKQVRINPEYHLFVTEGTDTEPFYFEAIKAEINKSFRDRISMEIIGEGDNTISLFQRAKKRAENSPNRFKHVWLVFDTDDFPAEHINRTVELCVQNSTDEMQYHAVWSNQCIELWFLLHFSFFQSDIHRSEYWPKLTECLNRIEKGDYDKKREDMYIVLKPYVKSAIKNAKKLESLNKGKLPAESAPGTKVYEIIEKLLPYLEL